MTQTINIDETLDQSGGATDAVTESYQLRSNTAAFQVEIGGATTDIDVHFEARLATDLGWADWIPARTGRSNGYSELRGVDVEDITDIRVRVVNQDGSNGADVRAVVTTGGD